MIKLVALICRPCSSGSKNFSVCPHLEQERLILIANLCMSMGTGLAGLVNAALIGIVLLCLTPVFRHMPLNALAAIVITGVIGLLDFPRVILLFQGKQRFTLPESGAF